MRFIYLLAIFFGFLHRADLYELYMSTKAKEQNSSIGFLKEQNITALAQIKEHEAIELSPDKCQVCHRDQTKYWERGYHAKSHEGADPLYAASIDLVAKKTGRLREEVPVECSACHNPELKIKNINENYKISKLFGVHTETVKHIDKQIRNATNLHGVGCSSCHRVDKLAQSDKAGSHAVEYIKEDSNVIVGPYNDVLRDEYHANEYREFFDDSNKLCLTCHDGIGAYDTNGKPNVISAYATSSEMANHDKSCVDCHMSDRYETINASYGDEIRVRYVRAHLFNGAHDIRQLKMGILFRFNKTHNNVEVVNNSAHMIPTGFGSRMIRITLSYKNADGKELSENVFDIGTRYLNKGEPALQYYADSLSYDNRLAPGEVRLLKTKAPNGATVLNLKAEFYYLRPDLVELFGNDKRVQDKEIIGPVEITDRNFNLVMGGRP